ncbi:adenylate/guanylate cyclase domain-containing protein [Bowmanella dokdonensis]|uniref:Adenylate/guanylate cyclase domain-containing protein n=1 Tax=Bowmanella dokdonensis TaxID=751969 RepID=A0A939IPW7_9ALTE|nr:adenylate/guanylate cyclase domain-containing protein [Bowmanella dokdonensis]MBN7823997.1 adenylate/guanylate cyclase domain-containing protein [Bowmanella dokdonensis]
MSEWFAQPLSMLLLGTCVLFAFIILMLAGLLRQARVRYHRPIVRLEGHTIQPPPDYAAAYKDEGESAASISRTFEKFVPRQFAEHFAKHGQGTLELGRADEDEVAILFCDIRGFTGLSERMSPQELMNFLNSYFMRMNEPIHANRGFIDKFIGDAIMALFDHPGGNNQDKARDCLQAAAALRKAVVQYNQHRKNSGYPPINIGIGAHFGPVILGTVGSEDRMDTTVIGDSVNIAYRLESLAPRYDADVLVSAQLLDTAGLKGGIPHRLLDWVRVKGKKNPVEIHEVFAHQDEAVQQQKLASASWLKRGIALRKDRRWQEAADCFTKGLEVCPGDRVLNHHIAQCHLLSQLALPQDWDGALDLDPADPYRTIPQ